MKVLIVFYSRYGNTASLAEAIAEGARSVAGAEVVVKRVRDLAPEEVMARDERWKQMRAELSQRYQEVTLDDLEWADAIVFGSANRYGGMAAEMKLFQDTTGPLWIRGALIGKVGAVFTTNSTAHSGKESTLLSMIVPLLHHGMVVVGVPPSVPETMTAGSYYGATATTGPMANNGPTQADLTVARALGQRVADVSGQLLKGRT